LTSSEGTYGTDERVLVLLRESRDAGSVHRVLESIGVASLRCVTPEVLCAEIDKGAGAVLIEEEALFPEAGALLLGTLHTQPSWSELPIMVLLRRGPETKAARDALLLPGDVILVERPVRVNTLVAIVRSALRSRRRQYLLRDQIRALEESETRYRTLFESIDEGFCIFEMLFAANGEPVDYRFLETNPAFEQHTGLVDVMGKTVRELVPDIENKWMEIYGRIAITGQPERFQEYSQRLGRWFEVYAFRTGDPEQRHVALLFTDISERKRAEEEAHAAKAAAEAASRAKSEFLANMSHEIRTPMTVFMAAIEHLLQIDRSPERRHLLGMAEQSAQRLRSLIDDILDLSRIEAHKVVIEEQPFDLREIVSAAVDLFILPARKKNLRLETDIDPDTPEMVAGDPEKIGQVLINLIGNAVKFTHQGEVRVCVQPRGEFLEFAVADTGIGIPEEKHHLLFQNFSQVDSSFTRQFGGTGLGLAISKGLVKLMGGEISVQSRAAEGSVFTFTLPLRRVEKASASLAEVPAEDIGKENAAARILLAEDEPMIREMITLMLAKRGLHPDTAESGRQAVEKWQNGDFDLIFMDLQMPEMSGMEATRAIREREREGIKRTCIIGLTAHASREIKEQCLDSGMDQVLTKPVKSKDLLAAVDACL
jgi:PAS domain S-box-containing protein